MVDNDCVVDPTLLQSHHLHLQLRGYQLQDAEHSVTRQRIKIPLTYPIAVEVMCVIDSTYVGALRQGYRAAIALGYALSLRPGEYLLQSPPRPISHQANSDLAVFWFGDVFYNICDPSLYPSGQIPDAFSILLDHVKNDPSGNNGPRSVYRSPTHSNANPDHFCCVRELFTFLSRYPPKPTSPVLSGLGYQLSSTAVNAILKATATRLDLDGSRLVPHSARFGVLQQIPDFSTDHKQKQGGWSTEAGMRTYDRRSLAHARSVAAAIHDPSTCPISHTVYMYNTK